MDQEEWPYPLNLKDVPRFLGFSNFYRRFIGDFLGIVGPFTLLSAKGINTESKLDIEDPNKVVENLIKRFSSSPFFIHFDFKLPINIHIDSSGYAYSGILSQKDPFGDVKTVAYFSRKLTLT